jgi:GntR family transcriptional regulator / MocR family aminotransferase
MTIDLPVLLDRSAAQPLSVQLAGQLRAAMRDGRMRAGERLPSSRALATITGVSRTVVTEAYQQLYAEGWLEGRHGSGTFVADMVTPSPTIFTTPDLGREDRRGGSGVSSAPVSPRQSSRPVGKIVGETIDLRPGMPWVAGLNTPAWRRAWRLAATVTPAARPDPHGLPELRGALTDYLRRSRGVACQEDGILITRGATNGLDLLAATMVRPGDRVGVEQPGYPAAAAVLGARGAEVVPCPVDENGLIVDALPEDLRILHTTPSHQYPIGGRLSAPRRQALVAWARRTGAIIAEDDYDGEFRYDVAPLPALYGLDPGVTVYLGTTSKIFAPDVGVGWLVARPDLVERIAARRRTLSDRTAVVPQAAMRIMLERGDLDRHIRRMRAEYARRRAAVVAALGHLSLRGETAGIHVLVELPGDVTDRLVAEAETQGVLLVTVDPYYRTPPGTAPGGHRVTGLVIGYGGATVGQVRTGCSLVRRLVSELDR